MDPSEIYFVVSQDFIFRETIIITKRDLKENFIKVNEGTSIADFSGVVANDINIFETVNWIQPSSILIEVL